MVTNFTTMGLLLIIQIYIVLYISEQIEIDKERDNYYNLNLLKKFIEILVIMIVILYTCYFTLRNNLDIKYIIQIIVFVEIFVVLFWLYLNFVESNIIDYGNDYIPSTKNNKNNNKNNKNNKPVLKPSNNFSFEYLYPNYKHSNSENNTSSNSGVKDYSAYNGYNDTDICYKCSCLKKSNGNIFCGKELPGLGMVGCSENWKCHNCKKCQTWDDKEGSNVTNMVSDNTSDKQYECRNCKCHETAAGIMCGKKTRLTGDIVKCNSSCERCSKCKIDSSNNSESEAKYRTIYPEDPIDIDKIVINNISKLDIENIL